MARNERQSRGRRRAAVENIKALFKEFNEERLALRRLWCERYPLVTPKLCCG